MSAEIGEMLGGIGKKHIGMVLFTKQVVNTPTELK